jgi:hypothetical protein
MDITITVNLPGGITIERSFHTMEEAREWARKARLEAMLSGK